MREVNVLVDNHLVRSTLRSPITIEYEGKREQYDDFTAEMNYDYYEKLILVKEFLAVQEKKGGLFSSWRAYFYVKAGDFEF